MTIYPAILTGNFSKAQTQLELAQSFGTSGVQLDIIDGVYADNLTLTPVDYAQLDFAKLKVDFHLMTDEPMDYLYEIIEHQKRLPTRAVIAQVEKMSYPFEFLRETKRYNFLAGLSLDLFTPLEVIEEEVFEELDVLQLMGVRAGFQGQEFNPQVLEIAQEALSLRDRLGLNFAVMIDGGVNLKTLELVKEVGVDAVVVGSQIWQADDPRTAYKQLVKLIK